MSKASSKLNQKKQKGIALVSVLFIMLILSVLAFTLSYAAISERKSTQSNTTTDRLIQIADSGSERARVSISETFYANNYTEPTFLEVIRQQLEGNQVHFPALYGVQSTVIDGTQVNWRISAVSSQNSEVGWIELTSSAVSGNDVQTIVRRIGFGSPNIFQLALLTETVNCMFCHLKVNGDIGTLGHFRPGWGTEGSSGINSGGSSGGSNIYGHVYAATTVTNDGTNRTSNPATINGAKVHGSVYENSKSSKLPKDLDGDGIPDFPPINRTIAEANAKGSLSVPMNATDGARLRTYGLTADATSGTIGSSNQSSINKTFNGHAVLVGTTANPIVLDKDVYISGDVILKGVIQGKGAIYAGRNIYLAGDVTLKTPPDKPGSGVCAGISNPDDCAKANIAADKDALRLAARGSIIIGDYTEYNSGSLKPWSQRQSADFYRVQFGFSWGNRYYDKRNSDELSCTGSGSSQVCKNIDGDVVAGTHVVSKNAQANIASNVMGDEAYDYSFRPGVVTANGGFDSWISDELYRTLLGSESFDHNTWRWNVSRASGEATNFKNNLKAAFAANGITISNASADNVWNNRNKGGSKTAVNNTSNVKVGEVHWDGNTIRVLVTANASYETQINRVEAFLYANKRIAGKTSMQAIAVNGGMIAQELGVLAPGRKLIWPWSLSAQEKCATSTQPYYVADTMDCALTVNYDYRLRNGGFGFNLVTSETGKTLSWQVADKDNQHIRTNASGGN